MLCSKDAHEFFLNNNDSNSKYSLLVLDSNNCVVELNHLSLRSFNDGNFNSKYMVSLALKAQGHSMYLFERIGGHDFFSGKEKFVFWRNIIEMSEVFNIKLSDYLIVLSADSL